MSSSNDEKIELLIQNDSEMVVFEYLFKLQESGMTNMFGAAAYIIRQAQFSYLTIDKAEELVNRWMTNWQAIKAIVDVAISSNSSFIGPNK
jgi:hypothetical protein